MAIQVECPYCGKETKVRDELDGKRIKCPGCKKPIVVGQDDGGTPCPECDAVIPKGGVLCLTCGYNMRTGQKVKAAAVGRKETALHHVVMGQPDALEGVRAFLERRAPRWQLSVARDFPRSWPE